MKDYYGFVYMWVNTHPKATKHTKYIGQHTGYDNDDYVGSGSIFKRRYYSKKYKGYWKRYILEYCKTLEELNEAEIKHIKEKNAQNSSEYCNIRAGGESGGKHSKAYKLKMSKMLKGRPAWNKGLKLPSPPASTIKKRVTTYNITRQKKREKDLKLIIHYVKKQGYIKRENIATVLGHKVSTTIITDRLNELVKRNKLKKIYYSKNDLRYVLPQFSLEDIVKNSIIAYIKDHPRCQAKDIKAHVTSMCNVTTSRVKLTLKDMVTKKQITKEQGYKTQHYTFNI